ncbi:unnamed protein product [Paramecium sonneborni]|uniref:F-box domain-containing protein n=1 Tax=Paramecium sonneborni TaxID=65129 RepID=A0A8S1P3D2_9CILI|nr:unnamed protein product [Paramecium sonneborni]
MFKQVPKNIGQQQNNTIKNKEGLKQFKNGQQQKQQGLPKQQVLKYFNKAIFYNIVVFLRSKEIMEFRLVNRYFNKLFIDCAPALLNYFDKKDDDQYMRQMQNPQRIQLPKLENVNLNTLKSNLENKGMYACVEKLNGNNLFCVELLFDMITLELPPWRKAKFTFPLKVKTIIEKYDFNLYKLNDQQIQLINQRQNYQLAEFLLYNEDFDELLSFVKNLKKVVAFQNYQYFCEYYEIEKENEERQILNNLLRSKSMKLN